MDVTPKKLSNSEEFCFLCKDNFSLPKSKILGKSALDISSLILKATKEDVNVLIRREGKVLHLPDEVLQSARTVSKCSSTDYQSMQSWKRNLQEREKMRLFNGLEEIRVIDLFLRISCIR